MALSLLLGAAAFLLFVGWQTLIPNNIAWLGCEVFDHKDLEDHRLLFARVVDALGDVDDALAAYDAARPGALGDEVRCRHAGVLERAGRDDDAVAIYTRIVKEAGHADARYRRENREWIQIAKTKLDESTAKRR